MPPTFDELRRCLYILDTAATKRLVRGTLDLPYEPDQPVAALQQLQILVADWLAGFSFLSDSQQNAVVLKLSKNLGAFSEALEAAGGNTKPCFTIVISDGRWVTCSFSDNFFDVQECLDVAALPAIAVTHIVCDVTALHTHAIQRLDQLRKLRSQGSKEAPDAPERANPKVSGTSP